MNPPTSHDKFYVTTSIAYPTATPHVGYAMELVQADVLARWQRGRAVDTFFLTGTDEHGQKLFTAAQKVGEDPAEYVAKTSDGFESLTKKLSLSNDGFVRTTALDHKAGAQKLWLACQKDIYKGEYSGLYCVDCERYYTEKESVEGACPIHKTALQNIKIESYFLRLESYRKQLIGVIESDNYRVFPQLRKNEVLSFLRSNELEDLSISRPKTQLAWGVEVPGDDSHVMYVWFDALSNYLTGLGFGSTNEGKFERLWPADVHVIGKDISRFHAVFWPIMLLSAGLSLPKSLYVHGFVNTPAGVKLSKSLGNSADPSLLIDTYGVDALRYYVLRYIPHDGDGEYSLERFAAVYESDLANDLGNLVQRVATMAMKYGDGEFAVVPGEKLELSAFLADCKFDAALSTIFDRVVLQNQRIEEAKPWQLVKTDEPAAREFLARVIAELVEVAHALTPFMPDTAQKIANTFKDGIVDMGVGILFPKVEGEHAE